MNLQMTAERERRAAVARAEGEKQALVLAAEEGATPRCATPRRARGSPGRGERDAHGR
jgi:regulator of protease activity HflC (stomatin/prohibitin superfamily)